MARRDHDHHSTQFTSGSSPGTNESVQGPKQSLGRASLVSVKHRLEGARESILDLLPCCRLHGAIELIADTLQDRPDYEERRRVVFGELEGAKFPDEGPDIVLAAKIN